MECLRLGYEHETEGIRSGVCHAVWLLVGISRLPLLVAAE